VRNSNVEDVIRFLLVTNLLARKVLSENTLLIYPNVAAKAREYQDLLTKTFYLANTDAKVAANLIRTLVKTKDLHIDEKLNLIVMRDTPDAVRMAERLIANQDLAEPEVMLEVEVLEVGTNILSEIGARWPDQFSYSLVRRRRRARVARVEQPQRRPGAAHCNESVFVINLKNQTGS
jgi:general secretion pathway protein D